MLMVVDPDGLFVADWDRVASLYLIKLIVRRHTAEGLYLGTGELVFACLERVVVYEDRKSRPILAFFAWLFVIFINFVRHIYLFTFNAFSPKVFATVAG